MTIAESFAGMQTVFNPAAAKGINKILQWNISGDQEGVWALHIHDQRCDLLPGGAPKPDLTFQVRDEDWLALAEGKLNQTQAFMSGKVKIVGDMMLAMKIPGMFPVKR